MMTFSHKFCVYKTFFLLYRTYNKDYISPDYHIVSNYTIKKLKEYKLDSVERISYEALFPAQDTSNYNGVGNLLYFIDTIIELKKIDAKNYSSILAFCCLNAMS